MNGLARLAASRKALRFCGFLLAAITLTLAPCLAFAGVNHWTSSGPLGSFVNSLAIDPNNPDTVYTVASQVVLKSRDGGVSWTTSLEPPSGSDPFVGGLAIDPVSPSNVYAGTPGGVFKSVDAGSSWNAMGPDHAKVYSLAIDPLAPSNVFAGTAGGIFKSTDGGGSWNGMLSSTSIYSLVFSAQKPAMIFGADFDSSFYYPNNSIVYKSADEGATWTPSVAPTGIPPGALAVDPASPSTLFAGSLRGAPSGFFKSTDSGLTWSLANDGSYVTAFVIDPQNSKTIYAGTNSGFVQSTDGGVSWRGFNTGRDSGPIWVTAMAIDQTGTRLYAGTDGGEVLSYQISSSGSSDQSAPLDLSVGRDNKTRVLFNDPDNRALLRSFDNSGNSTTDGFHGPYSGWRPRAVADGTDGLTRVLWNNVDGSAALWLLGQTGNQASYLYGPSTGWTAVDVSVGSDGTTHLLWTNIDGRTKLTSVAISGTLVADTTYGPFSGWVARSISDGADGLTRILWTNNDGRVGLSLVDAGQIAATYRFAPGPGWTALDVAVATDNRARILFVDAR